MSFFEKMEIFDFLLDVYKVLFGTFITFNLVSYQYPNSCTNNIHDIFEPIKTNKVIAFKKLEKLRFMQEMERRYCGKYRRIISKQNFFFWNINNLFIIIIHYKFLLCFISDSGLFLYVVPIVSSIIGLIVHPFELHGSIPLHLCYDLGVPSQQ